MINMYGLFFPEWERKTFLILTFYEYLNHSFSHAYNIKHRINMMCYCNFLNPNMKVYWKTNVNEMILFFGSRLKT